MADCRPSASRRRSGRSGRSLNHLANGCFKPATDIQVEAVGFRLESIGNSAISTYLTWRYLEARRTSDAGTQRLGISGRRLTSAREICRLVATRLKLNVVFVESTDWGVQASAGAPRPVRFDIPDRKAIRACLETGKPSGIASGPHGAPDGLFIPLQQRGQTVAVAGVAGPHCPRRLDPNETGMQSLRRNFERYLSERDLKSEQAPPTKVAPRLTVITNGRADAA